MKLSRKRARTSKALRVPASTPRNPLVVAAHKRKAGLHRKTRKAERSAAKAALRRGED